MRWPCIEPYIRADKRESIKLTFVPLSANPSDIEFYSWFMRFYENSELGSSDFVPGYSKSIFGFTIALDANEKHFFSSAFTEFVIAALQVEIDKIGTVLAWRERIPRPVCSSNLKDATWTGGLKAWKIICEISANELDRLNVQLMRLTQHSQQLEFVRKSKIVIPMQEQSYKVWKLYEEDGQSQEKWDEFIQELGRKFEDIICEHDAWLYEKRQNTWLEPHDLSSSLMHLIPIMTAIHSSDKRTWLIDEPELHAHPHLQAEIGDLIISSLQSQEANESKSVVLATHSENLILRILRRIRETHKGIVPVEFSLFASQLSVYHLGYKDDKVVSTRIDVDTNGDFIQPWPDDFFEVDFHERFAL